MAYTLDIAESVANTVGKFVTLNRHQLSGHLANMDFWCNEVQHALSVIDTYFARQRKLERAQKEHIQQHDTRRFDRQEFECATIWQHEPLPAARADHYRIPDQELKRMRAEVCDALYGFLKRCHKERLLAGDRAKELLGNCGIGWQPGDFADSS